MSTGRRRLLAMALLCAGVLVLALGVVARQLPVTAFGVVTVSLLVLPGLVALRGRYPGAVPALVTGLLIGPLIAVPTWLAAHPVLHVDNATGEPVEIWLDGVRTRIVPVGREDEEPLRLRLPFGAHRLAWSVPGAPVGLHELEVRLSPFDEHLWSPGAAGCYWVSVTAYGQASTHGLPHGPLPLDAFHRFDYVDAWFADNPKLTRAPRIARGTVRVAVQRHRACMALRDEGCDDDRRRAYVDCVSTIDGRAVPVDCWAEAAKGCASVPSAASTSGTAQAGKP